MGKFKFRGIYTLFGTVPYGTNRSQRAEYFHEIRYGTVSVPVPYGTIVFFRTKRSITDRILSSSHLSHLSH